MKRKICRINSSHADIIAFDTYLPMTTAKVAIQACREILQVSPADPYFMIGQGNKTLLLDNMNILDYLAKIRGVL